MHGVKKGSGHEAIRRSLTEEDHKKGSELFGKLIELIYSDPDIDELGLLVGLKGKSPAFFLEEHKLGISFWCIAPLYSYAFKLFTAVVKTLKGENSEILPAAAKSLTDSSKVILMINPDMHTCWNIRKRIIKMGLIKYDDELKYLSVVFTKHPKSGAAWAHRRWILRQVPPFKGLESKVLRDCPFECTAFKDELKLCEFNASHNKNNYYAWTHREWLLDRISSKKGLLKELDWVRKFNSMHVSEYSGLHYRYQVLLKLLQTSSAAGATLVNDILSSRHSSSKSTGAVENWVVKMVEEELESNQDLIMNYCGFESLWTYRRVLFLLQLRLKGLSPSKIISTLDGEIKKAVAACAEDVSLHDTEKQSRHSATFQMWCIHAATRQCEEYIDAQSVNKKDSRVSLELRKLMQMRKTSEANLEKYWPGHPSISLMRF